MRTPVRTEKGGNGRAETARYPAPAGHTAPGQGLEDSEHLTPARAKRGGLHTTFTCPLGSPVRDLRSHPNERHPGFTPG